MPKLSLLERRDVKRVKPIRPIPTYIQSDAGFGDFGVGLSSPISPTFGKLTVYKAHVVFEPFFTSLQPVYLNRLVLSRYYVPT